MDDETKQRLTELWREAGLPLADGMQMHNGDVVNSAELVEFITPSGCIESGLLAHAPDWDHPMTEFAMMCAAEQAAGCLLRYAHRRPAGRPKLAGSWEAKPVIRRSDVGWAGPCETRIECALAVIKACREAKS